LAGNTSPATKDAFSGTITEDKDVPENARASICTNSESVSNEIDESDLQCEKHDKQRI
jgi:uncharacterized protein (UPF0147 family)